MKTFRSTTTKGQIRTFKVLDDGTVHASGKGRIPTNVRVKIRAYKMGK